MAGPEIVVLMSQNQMILEVEVILETIALKAAVTWGSWKLGWAVGLVWGKHTREEFVLRKLGVRWAKGGCRL